jgi:hypothetical protein
MWSSSRPLFRKPTLSERVAGTVWSALVAVAFGYVLYAPYWLANRFYGPFHAPDWMRNALPVAFAIVGLCIFIGIGVSRQAEAYKVRWFGGAIVGAFMVGTLFVLALHRLSA